MLHRPSQHCDRRLVLGSCYPPEMCRCLGHHFPSAQVVSRSTARPNTLCSDQMRLDSARDAGCYLILESEYFYEVSVVSLGPVMTPCQSINQLRGDANTIY